MKSKVPVERPVLNCAEPKRRLLVLDDDADIGATINSIAQKAGMETRSVQTSSAFEATMVSFEPDVIVLDLMMPECDGIEMLHRLKAWGCTADIILNSGVDPRVLMAAGRTVSELGLRLRGTLTKPFLPRTLRRMLQHQSLPHQPSMPLSTPFLPGVVREVVQERFSPDLAAIDAGLLAQQFVLFFQPKVRCNSNELLGFEALVRWRHPGLGLLFPDQFMPLIEASNRIDLLTDQIIDQSLAFLAGLPPKHAGLTMAINISPRSLHNIGLADLIEVKCLKAGIEPARITLEITEASAMANPVVGLAVTTRFCMKAFKLSIDDFGVGYSSLVQLVRLPFAELKIDRQFVADIKNRPDHQAIVEAIVLLGHRLGLTVTAEGVETQEAMSYLAAIGCDAAQGFGIARPMPGSVARDWIDSNARQR